MLTARWASRYPDRVTVLVSVTDVRQLSKAERTVRQFWQQTYPVKQLVVLNTTQQTLHSRFPAADRELFRELDVPTAMAHDPLTIGQSMLDPSDWLMVWHPDSVQHPHRLIMQMAVRSGEVPVMLSSELRLDMSSATLVRFDDTAKGLPETALVPNRPRVFETLPDSDRVIFDNRLGFPGPALVARLRHAHSLESREQFLGTFSAEQYVGRAGDGVTRFMAEWLDDRLRDYGLKLGVSSAD